MLTYTNKTKYLHPFSIGRYFYAKTFPSFPLTLYHQRLVITLAPIPQPDSSSTPRNAIALWLFDWLSKTRRLIHQFKNLSSALLQPDVIDDNIVHNLALGKIKQLDHTPI